MSDQPTPEPESGGESFDEQLDDVEEVVDHDPTGQSGYVLDDHDPTGQDPES